MKKITQILFLFGLLSSTTYAAVNDFCVADLKGPDGPSGYQCKPPNTVTVDDFVFSGQITAGFMTPFHLYMKTLKPGDVMVFPQGQLHFQVNSGKGKATAFLAFSSANPGAQLLDLLLFGNSLPSDVIAQTTFLDVEQVKKLKARFGGK
ncbi:Auxin-binding protein [Vigna angularis]|uniref:Germin-like protein n=1 Tax=Phaseolus angularis TaxID=3914 RepID=A0A8T0JQF7_PHAAN|nr:Auxin-binding protein [Vigna angularis]KAG2380023.1 Auxin-binding protein [Vigna angularis]